MSLISFYLVSQSISEAAITPVISAYFVMLDCMKVTWCTHFVWNRFVTTKLLWKVRIVTVTHISKWIALEEHNKTTFITQAFILKLLNWETTQSVWPFTATYILLIRANKPKNLIITCFHPPCYVWTLVKSVNLWEKTNWEHRKMLIFSTSGPQWPAITNCSCCCSQLLGDASSRLPCCSAYCARSWNLNVDLNAEPSPSCLAWPQIILMWSSAADFRM